MTDRQLRAVGADDDERDVLDQEDREAELLYRGVTRGKKDEKKGANTPLPAAGGAAAQGGGAGSAPAAAASSPAVGSGVGAPAAFGGAAVGSATVHASASASEVRFEGKQLAAGGVGADVDDPWGAYDNPDNVPGLSLEDDEDEDRRRRDSMALRGSGTRKGAKGGGAGGPGMMPMGGAGGAGVGAAPGATVGGVGAMPNAALQQQQMAVQNTLGGAQQGSIPMSALSGLGSARASGAMMAPPASGVLAAGSDGLSVDRASLDETLLRMGADPTQEFIVGPDGNLYPNPAYQGSGSGSAPGGSSQGLAADLNGDGDVSPAERARWEAAQERTGGVSQTVGDLNQGSYGGSGVGTGSTGTGSTGAGSSSGGVSQAVGNLNQGSYGGSGTSGVGTGSSTGSGSSSGGSGSSTGGVGASTPPYGRSSSSGAPAVRGSSYSVDSSELNAEAKEWERVAAEQEQLSREINNLPDPRPIFGVLENMVQPYSEVQAVSAETAMDGGADSTNTSDQLDHSAAGYAEQESSGTGILEGMNDL